MRRCMVDVMPMLPPDARNHPLHILPTALGPTKPVFHKMSSLPAMDLSLVRQCLARTPQGPWIETWG